MVNLRSSGLPVVFDPEPERTIRRNTLNQHNRGAESMASGDNSPQARRNEEQRVGTPLSKGGELNRIANDVTLEEMEMIKDLERQSQQLKQSTNPKDNPEFYDLEGDDSQLARHPVLDTIVRNEKVYYIIPGPPAAGCPPRPR